MSETNGKVDHYPPAIIPDGFERTVIFDGVVGAHPPCQMTYRVSRGFESMRELALGYAQTNEMDDKAYAALAGRISKWDLLDADGEPLEICGDNLRRMVGPLMSRIHYCVVGQRGPDREVLANGQIDENPSADVDLIEADLGN